MGSVQNLSHFRFWLSGEVERGLTIRECAHDAGAPPDLTQDALERIVGANPPNVSHN